ncbi:hypothetical protein [Ferruginibacter sp.]
MKYKDLGTLLSKEEMKNVKGGYKLPNGCLFRCCAAASGGECTTPIAIAVPNCDPETLQVDAMGCMYNPPWPASCTCMNPS